MARDKFKGAQGVFDNATQAIGGIASRFSPVHAKSKKKAGNNADPAMRYAITDPDPEQPPVVKQMAATMQNLRSLDPQIGSTMQNLRSKNPHYVKHGLTVSIEPDDNNFYHERDLSPGRLIPLSPIHLGIADAFSEKFTKFDPLQFCPPGVAKDPLVNTTFREVWKEFDILARTDFHDRLGSDYTTSLEKAVIKSAKALFTKINKLLMHTVKIGNNARQEVEDQLKKMEKKMYEGQIQFSKEINSLRALKTEVQLEEGKDVNDSSLPTMFVDSINVLSPEVQELVNLIVTEKVKLLLSSKQRIQEFSDKHLGGEEAVVEKKNVAGTAAMRMKMITLEAKIDKLNSQIKTLQTEVEEEKKKGADAVKIRETLEARLKQRQEQLSELEDKIKEMRLKEEEQGKELRAAQKKIQSMEESLGGGGLEIEKLKALLAQKEEEFEKAISKLHAEYSSNQPPSICMNCRSLESKIKTLNQQIEEVKKELETERNSAKPVIEKQVIVQKGGDTGPLEQQLQSLQEKLRQSEEDYQASLGKLNESLARNEMLKKEKQKYENQIKKLRDELAASIDECTKIKIALEEIKVRLAKMERALQDKMGEKGAKTMMQTQGLDDMINSDPVKVKVWVRLYADAVNRLSRYAQRRVTHQTNEESVFLQAMKTLSPWMYHQAHTAELPQVPRSPDATTNHGHYIDIIDYKPMIRYDERSRGKKTKRSSSRKKWAEEAYQVRTFSPFRQQLNKQKLCLGNAMNPEYRTTLPNLQSSLDSLEVQQQKAAMVMHATMVQGAKNAKYRNDRSISPVVTLSERAVGSQYPLTIPTALAETLAHTISHSGSGNSPVLPPTLSQTLNVSGSKHNKVQFISGDGLGSDMYDRHNVFERER